MEHIVILRDELLGGGSHLALVELFMGLGLQRQEQLLVAVKLFIAEVHQSRWQRVQNIKVQAKAFWHRFLSMKSSSSRNCLSFLLLPGGDEDGGL